MVEKKIIQELAAPFLEKLKDYSELFSNAQMLEIPQVHFLAEAEYPFMMGNIEVTQEIVRALEEYLQEAIEEMVKPTVFH